MDYELTIRYRDDFDKVGDILSYTNSFLATTIDQSEGDQFEMLELETLRPSRNKGKSKATPIALNEHDDSEPEIPEPQSLPIGKAAGDCRALETKNSHGRQDDGSGFLEANEALVPVILLQTTLRSSQIQSLRHRLRLPVSGHWALLIRDEVFELNRTSRWLWYYNLRPRDQTEFGIGLLNAFASIPQFGACAHLDRCTVEQYEQDRGQWTTKVYLGTTKMSQEAIHSAGELAEVISS